MCSKKYESERREMGKDRTKSQVLQAGAAVGMVLKFLGVFSFPKTSESDAAADDTGFRTPVDARPEASDLCAFITGKMQSALPQVPTLCAARGHRARLPPAAQFFIARLRRCQLRLAPLDSHLRLTACRALSRRWT
jgi:hypothetical protein